MILIQRVIAGQQVAHVAKEMGIWRTTAHKWINRYRAQGPVGLEDRSSKTKSCPHAARSQKVREVLQDRIEHGTSPADLAARTGIKARTVSRILAAAVMAHLWGLAPCPESGSVPHAPPASRVHGRPRCTDGGV
ncbi:helix-turn-helix domain-containing protein [Arthrobacter gengyunqii]|uniref:Helix-turn-helix domain-containing protein n=1 Tax=Arthrobacter gengyunqii TaxID=2886940 RepID=A0ABS8GJC7_9MICC|nr:leucine zipper domain-containing protein [Arthrobacter gengyunqii]MCC3266670.1 helix-turn-helix domain-containing protein [Arthrobacter gengyunqii]